MKTFVVQMDCVKGKEHLVMEKAGLHIKWMVENIKKNIFIVAGPYINKNGAFDDGLCIIKSNSQEELTELLKTDPFFIHGIRDFKIRLWDYHVNETGYRISFPPEAKQLWDLE